MANEIKTPDPKYVRLTKNEMSQLRKLKVGQVFYHINLNHSDTNQYPNGTKFKAVEIIKTGRVSKTKVIDPKINLRDGVTLELLETETNIKVSNLKDIDNKEMFLFDNKKGLYESLVNRYLKVLEITAEDIYKMSCYIRKFRII
jgi:hypothetical protein